jgi:O-glycosyl hydrolase
MTRSGCAAGSADGGDNLQDSFVDSFAAYLAEVVAHFATEWDVVFRTVAPFNEPSTSWWKSSNRQEGCHFSRESQNAFIPRLSAHLVARGLTGTTISAADEYSIDETVDTFNAYDQDALPFVSQVNTHSYGGARRADLGVLAATLGKRLWMSEWGTGAGPHDHEAIAPALTLAQQIVRDMNDLRPDAWVYWQAVENEAANNWGFIHADFTGADERFWPTKQYYGMAQFSTFMRPGYWIVGTADVNTLAGYERASGRLVLAYVNGVEHDVEIRFDLAAFGTKPGAAMAHRTSAAESMARLPDLPVSHHDLAVTAAAQSISTYILDGIEL